MKVLIGIILFILAMTFFLLIQRNTESVPEDIPARKKTMSQQIPKCIYQTMKTKHLPKQMKKYIDSWIKLNPDYEYHFYDDNRCRSFIKNNFNPRVLNAYDSLIPGAFKADLWRYCLLYVKGGVYVDVDMLSLSPLNEIISPTDQFITVRDQHPTALFNAFIACIPGHPFLGEMISYVVNMVETKSYGSNCLEPTGPHGFGKVISRMIGNYGPFDIGEIKNTNYKLKLLKFPLGSQYIYQNNKAIILNKYSEYNKNMADLGQTASYYELWKRRAIYR